MGEGEEGRTQIWGVGMETSCHPNTCPGRPAPGGSLIFMEEYFQGKWAGQGGLRNTSWALVLAWPEPHCETLVKGCSPPQFLAYRPGESDLWLPRALPGLRVFESVKCGDSVF